MKLRSDASLPELLQKISLCSDDVFFTTTDGDVLNLKSALSQFVFAVATAEPNLLSQGEIICKNTDDISIIRDFLR